MTSVIVGTWHEREARDITRCPSYYAADYETLRTMPGDYPVRVTFEGGYTIPMPYWVLVGINSTRVNGALFSGFGGNNFAKTDLPAGEAVTYSLQTYVHTIPDMVADGRLTLAPGFEWLNDKDHGRVIAAGPRTWDAVRALAGQVSA